MPHRAPPRRPPSVAASASRPAPRPFRPRGRARSAPRRGFSPARVIRQGTPPSGPEQQLAKAVLSPGTSGRRGALFFGAISDHCVFLRRPTHFSSTVSDHSVCFFVGLLVSPVLFQTTLCFFVGLLVSFLQCPFRPLRAFLRRPAHFSSAVSGHWLCKNK